MSSSRPTDASEPELVGGGAESDADADDAPRRPIADGVAEDGAGADGVDARRRSGRVEVHAAADAVASLPAQPRVPKAQPSPATTQSWQTSPDGDDVSDGDRGRRPSRLEDGPTAAQRRGRRAGAGRRASTSPAIRRQKAPAPDVVEDLVASDVDDATASNGDDLDGERRTLDGAAAEDGSADGGRAARRQAQDTSWE